MFSCSYPCSFQTIVTESDQNYAWPTDFICHVYLFFQFASHHQKLVQLPAFSCHLTCHSIFFTIDFSEVTLCGWCDVTNPVTKLFHRGDIWQWFFFFFFFCSTLPNWLKKTWLHIYDTIPVFRLQGISKCLRDPLKFAPEMNNYIRSGTSEY